MKICEPYNGEDLVWHPVTPAMSKTSFQGPECCKPLKRKSIATFFKPKSAPGICQPACMDFKFEICESYFSFRNKITISRHAGWASDSMDRPQSYTRQAVRWLIEYCDSILKGCTESAIA